MSKQTNYSKLITELEADIKRMNIEVNKLHEKVGQIDSLNAAAGRLEKSVEKIQEKVDRIKDEMLKSVKDEYVNNDRFEPVKLIVFGIAALVFVVVFSALLGLVIVPPVLP